MWFIASLVAQVVKNLPAMQETRVRSLSRGDPLENGMATHSSILAWRIPWTEEPSGLQSVGLQRVGHNWTTNIFTLSLSPCLRFVFSFFFKSESFSFWWSWVFFFLYSILETFAIQMPSGKFSFIFWITFLKPWIFKIYFWVMKTLKEELPSSLTWWKCFLKHLNLKHFKIMKVSKVI